jgi:hypothetical protein
VKTLDSFFRDSDPRLDFIKIDTQGAECRVLRGAAATIKRNPSIVMMLEYYPRGLEFAGSSGKELIALLGRYKFTVRNIREPGILNLSHVARGRHTNLICFGPEAEVPCDV